MDAETKIIYHIDDEDTPYLVTVPVPSDLVTLADFKAVLNNRPGYKYFFKSMDDDFGVVKEEIGEDSAKLPYFNGRVVGTARGLLVKNAPPTDTQTDSRNMRRLRRTIAASVT